MAFSCNKPNLSIVDGWGLEMRAENTNYSSSGISHSNKSGKGKDWLSARKVTKISITSWVNAVCEYRRSISTDMIM